MKKTVKKISRIKNLEDATTFSLQQVDEICRTMLAPKDRTVDGRIKKLESSVAKIESILAEMQGKR